MNTPSIAPAHPERPASILPALIRAISGAARRLVAAHRAREARIEFMGLDARTLRDIGVSGCEYDSYLAEMQGRAEITRVRVAQDVRGLASARATARGSG